VCPNRAIAELQRPSGPYWEVNPALCTQCKGGHTGPDGINFYATEQCIDICPLQHACIDVDPEHTDTVEQLTAKGDLLADYRASLDLPRNYAYQENKGLKPAKGEFGPIPPEGWTNA
jgi:hypothetical protein